MTTQTTYSERMAPPAPGTLAGQVNEARITTGICETAAPGIAFGRAVSQGTLSDEGVILGGSLAGFRGVSVRDITLRGDVATANLDKYQPPNSMAVMESGDIWVEPNEAVTAHAAVYFVAATGLFSDNSSGAVGPVPGAYWKTSCGVGGRAILSIPQGGRAA
jgi:hypothetical protein